MLARLSHTPVDQLTAAVDELAHESIEGHATHALSDDLVALRREIDRLEAQFVRRLNRFDRNHGALGENAPSTIAWLRGTCRLTKVAAADRVRMARTFEELPIAAASFRDGRSPIANVSLIARLAETVGCAATRTAEQTLVTAAEKLDAGRMFRLTLYTRHCLDADGALDQDNRNYQRRWFACDRTYDGVFVLRGELDSEGGAIIQSALDASSQKRGPEDTRTGSQRRADALVDMASAMLRSGDLPSVHGERPHLVLTASLDALRGVSGAPPPELQGVGPVNVQTARRIACDASRRVATVLPSSVGVDAATRAAVTGADAGIGPAAETDDSSSAATGTAGAPTAAVDRSYSIGRASRTIPAAMRTAIALRDDGCRFPGCDRPAAWTDGHHVEHWADHGETEVPNLLSLCRFHHRVTHEGGYDIRLLPDGTVAVSPRGERAPAPLFHRRE